jgi:hypothetical protein
MVRGDKSDGTTHFKLIYITAYTVSMKSINLDILFAVVKYAIQIKLSIS